MEGWVKIHRCIVDNDLWHSEPFSRGQAWIDLIILANHKESFFYKRGNKVVVKRGQIGRSEVELSDRWRWSRTKIRKFLIELEKEQQIIIHKSTITQLLTIVNYDVYQEKEQQTGQQKDSRKTTKVQQKNTYKNDKNEKNDKNVEEEGEKENFPPPHKTDLEQKEWEQTKDAWQVEIESSISFQKLEDGLKTAFLEYCNYRKDLNDKKKLATATAKQNLTKVLNYTKDYPQSKVSESLLFAIERTNIDFNPLFVINRENELKKDKPKNESSNVAHGYRLGQPIYTGKC